MKNKTLSAWLTLTGGPLGLHRFYLMGWSDRLGWLLPVPTLIGLYGVWRARTLGLDDQASWVLIPLLGFTMAACALNAIVYGLMNAETWNQRFNPSASPQDKAGQSNGLTVAGVVVALFLGTTCLMATLAFSFQRYFEYQTPDAVQTPRDGTATQPKTAPN